MEGFGERLKRVRSFLQMDKPSFAEALDVGSTNTIYRWEKGLAYPPADKLHLMHEKFGISIDWLVTGAGEMKAGEGSPGSKAEACPEGEVLDRDMMAQVIRGVEKWLNKKQAALPPDKKAELILLLYEHFRETEGQVEEKTVERYLRLVV